MMTIKETKVTKAFEYEAEPYTLNGSFVSKEEALESFNADIKGKGSAYKGNAYLRDGEFRYNFSNVDPAEVGEIAAVCESCLAEVKAMIA